MRSILALGLLLALCTSASAAKVRHTKPHVGHSRQAPPVDASVPRGIAVPGWTVEQTQNWLNSYGYGTD
jgi:hypothetical protein